MIEQLGTYLPPWANADGSRACGADEDAITLAVAAGRAANRDLTIDVSTVVLVTRDWCLLEGGNAAALLGGLGLARSTDVVERLGGAPAALDAVSLASPRTLVIAVDVFGAAGAAAAIIGEDGVGCAPLSRIHRSLPLRIRHADGRLFIDEDPRLQREQGLRKSLNLADILESPVVIAGASSKESSAFVAGPPADLPTSGASASLFALASLADRGENGVVVASEQATVSAVRWDTTGVVVVRDEPGPQPISKNKVTIGTDIKLSHTAYERAFESKVRWEAAQCPTCCALSFPPRFRCFECGSEELTQSVALPRFGTVYTSTTIHVPVPGLSSPYCLVVVELDGTDVRVLVGVTDREAPSLKIGTQGRLSFRRVAMRAGIPDYGYAFCPDEPS